jgi:hypothetical protein
MLYDYDGLLLIIKRMIVLARYDEEQAHGEDQRSAYLFLHWVRRYLVPYLEDIGGE